jgi:hypothetical protein
MSQIPCHQFDEDMFHDLVDEMARARELHGDIVSPHEAIAVIREEYLEAEPLWQAQALCFVKGRLHFSGTSGCGRFASALAYFGPEPWRFEGAFEDIGTVIRL